MITLSRNEILLLLQLVGAETVIEPSALFPYRVSMPTTAWSSDPMRAHIQAELSIWLEIATRREMCVCGHLQDPHHMAYDTMRRPSPGVAPCIMADCDCAAFTKQADLR